MISSKRSANELPSSVQTALWEGGSHSCLTDKWEDWGPSKGGEFPQLHSKATAGLKALSSLHLIPWAAYLLEMKLPHKLTRGFWHRLKAYIIQHPFAYTNSKENFHMAQGQSSQKNHGSLRKSVLPDKHKWNTIPHGCRAQGVFLYAILGLA